MANTNNGANLGFEDKLWAAADKMRGHMDASEYKHVVLGLIFLKYISDAFQVKYNELESKKDTEFTDPEDRDEYAASNIFWVPLEARWAKLPLLRVCMFVYPGLFFLIFSRSSKIMIKRFTRN